MWLEIGIIAVFGFLLILGYWYHRNKGNKTLELVPEVDLKRYSGVWYEIARLPVVYQEGCKNSVAMYDIRPDNKLNIVNRCEIDGRQVEVRGIGIPKNGTLDPKTKILRPGSLKVVFDRSPVLGDYNILYLDKDYQYSIVGTPDKKSLWILSRTEKISDDVYESLVERAQNMGYDISSLIKN